MIKSFLIIPVCLITGIIHAQTIIEKHIPYTQNESVSLNIQIADSIKIIPWDKDEVYVNASVNVNDNKDNDQYQWTFENSGNEITIRAKFPEDYFRSRQGNNSCCSCCDDIRVYCEVHIPTGAGLHIETINGDLILAGVSKEIHAKTISGFIDMAAPSALKADMQFKTVTGTVFTNFMLNTGTSQHSGPTNFSASLNGGGNPIELETISGNIYFRKIE